MRKETIYHIEVGDTVYLIDDNLDIKEIVLNDCVLNEHLHLRSYISDEVSTIEDRYVIKDSKIHDDQIDLLKVEFFTSSDFQDRKDFDKFGYRYHATDQKVFTSKDAAETYLATKMSKFRICNQILKDTHSEIDIHLNEIENILKHLSNELRKYEIPDSVLLNSNLTLISRLCDILNLDVAEILNLDKEQKGN